MKKSLLKMKKTVFLVFFMAGLMMVSSFMSVFAYPVANANKVSGKMPVPAEGKNTESLITEIDDPAFDTTKYIDPEKVIDTTSHSVGGDKEVSIMVVADDRSLMKKFNESAYKDYGSISSYITSLSGQAYASNLLKKQEELKAQLSSLYDIEFNYSFTTLFNGFSATVKYSDISSIEKLPYVSRVVISEKYAAPSVSSYELMAASNGTDAVENNVEIYKTGIFDSSNSGYNGLGMTVAVVDTGVDYEHPSFDPNTFLNGLSEEDKGKIAVTKESLEEKFANGLELVAGNYPVEKADGTQAKPGSTEGWGGNTEGLTASDVYINEKIPYGYDYADHDPDCFPINDHGTHVAGIIAGENHNVDDKEYGLIDIIGVAPKAQIFAMKVFPDADDGSESEDILAAVEDCVRLGVDVINMSLGRDSGFARESDEEFTNAVYDGVEAAGITLVCAASNSYSSGFNSTYGSNLLENPDSGTVGSPSTYHSALSVASISGQLSSYMYANGTTPIYFNNSVDNNSQEIKFFDDFYSTYNYRDDEEVEIEYVVVPGTGDSPNYIGIDVRNKVALIQRGILSFEDKIKQAQRNGAAAAIVYNNVAGNISMVVGDEDLIPSCSITLEMGKILVEAAEANKAQGGPNGGTLTFNKANQAGPFMSDFSSWGPSPDLELKPEITGHGGDIYSSIIGGGYDHMSGTSMASPNLAGVATLIRQHIKENLEYYFGEGANWNDKETLVKARALVHQLLMSTATPALTYIGNPVSPRHQGAGLANLTAAINTDTMIYVKDKDGTILDKTKLSLGDDPARNGIYELEFYIKNYSDNTKEYTFNPIVMTESVNIDLKTVAEKAYMITDSDIKVETDNGITYDASTGKVTVAPKADARFKVTITLSSETKTYIEESFKNGMYVEGFIRFETEETDNYSLNIPYLAFYGNWIDAPLYDLDFKAVYSDKFDSLIPDDEKTRAAVMPLTLAGKRTVDGEDFVSYMGEYIYLLPEPEENYSAPTYHDDYVSLSLDPNGVHDFYLIGGFLRNVERMDVKITHAETGELMAEDTFWNGSKAGLGSIGGILTENSFDVTTYVSENGKRFEEGNRYTFSMVCKLGYGGEYGWNVPMNTYSFDFVIDSTPPTLEDYQVRVEYKPKETVQYRYYLDLYIYDNNYPQGYQVQFYDKNEKKYVSPIGHYMMPINTQKNTVSKVTVDVTNYWERIKESDYTIYVTSVDYSMNDSTYFFKIVGDIDNKEYGVYNNITGIKLADNVLDASSTPEAPVLKEKLKIWQSYDLFSNYALDVKTRWHDDYKKFGDACVAAKLATYNSATDTYTFDSSVKLSNWLSVERSAWLEDYEFKSDNAAFSVTDRGVITPLPEAAGQSANITVSSKTDPNVKYSFKVECGSATADDTYAGRTQINISKVELSYNYIELPIGAEYEVTAKVLPEDINVDYQIKWTINNEKRASLRLDANDFTHAYVMGLTEGNTTLRAVVQTKDSTGNWVNTTYGASCSISVPEEYVIQYEILNEYHGAEKNLVIPADKGIKTIGPGVFMRNNTLETVVIPEGVETIDSAAFAYCNNLREVTLPSTLKVIKDWAFTGWVDWETYAAGSNLEVVKINKIPGQKSLLRYIGKRAFMNCMSLREIDISEVSVIDEYAFLQCPFMGYNKELTSATTVDISGVKTIGDFAFAYCYGVLGFNFSAQTIIGDYAFTGCGFIAQATRGVLTIPCTHIGAYAFSDCTTMYSDGSSMQSITRVDLTGTDVMIGDYAFADNGSLSTVNFNGTVNRIGNRAFANTGLLQLNMPKGLQILGDMAFENCTKLRTLFLNNVDEIPVLLGNAFEGCTTLRTINVKTENTQYSLQNGILYQDRDSDGNNDTIVMALGVSASTFADNKIPDDITRIEKYAFKNSTLSEIDLNNVTELGEGAFRGSNRLTKVTMSEDLTEISDYAFSGCVRLANVIINGSELNKVGNYAFYGCEKLEKINLNHVEAIGDYAFCGTTMLNKVTTDGNLSRVGAYAFEGCSLLAEINLSQVETVGANAFDGCKFLSTVTSLDRAVRIGAYAFRNTTALKIESLKDAEYIGAFAFSGSGIETIDLPEVITLGNYAFGLNFNYAGKDDPSIDPPEDETLVNQATYDYSLVDPKTVSKLTSVTMPNVQWIGDGAFSGAQFTEIEIPSSVKYVGARAFANSKVKEFTVADGNEMFYAESGVLYRKVPNGYELISYPTAKEDTTFDVMKDTIRIEEGAFINNKNLTSIDLPEELLYIGNYAFFGCDALNHIDFHAYRAPVLELGFYVVDGVIVRGYSVDNDAYIDNSAIEQADRNYAVFFNFGKIPALDAENIDNSQIIITYPANGVNYTDFLYARYFALAKSSATEEQVKDEGTLSFIRRVRNELIPKNITLDNVAEDANAALVRDLYGVYDALSATQKKLLAESNPDIVEIIDTVHQYAVQKHVDKVWYTVEFFGADIPEEYRVQEVEHNGHVNEPPTPTKAGYTFDGWYTTSTFRGSKFNFGSFVTSNIKLYAKFVDENGNTENPNEGDDDNEGGCSCGTIGVGGNFDGFIGGGLLLLALAGVTLLLRRRRESSK